MIDLTPLDVRKKKGDFRRGLRGYEPQQVDDFLDVVADRLDALVREHQAFGDQVRRLEQQVAEYREREKALTEALVTAQEMREEMRAQVAREADLSRRTAEQDADRIRASAMQAREREEEMLRRLHARQLHFIRTYRGFLEKEIAELASMAAAVDLSDAVTEPAAPQPPAAGPSGPPSKPAPSTHPPSTSRRGAETWEEWGLEPPHAPAAAPPPSRPAAGGPPATPGGAARPASAKARGGAPPASTPPAPPGTRPERTTFAAGVAGASVAGAAPRSDAAPRPDAPPRPEPLARPEASGRAAAPAPPPPAATPAPTKAAPAAEPAEAELILSDEDVLPEPDLEPDMSMMFGAESGPPGEVDVGPPPTATPGPVTGRAGEALLDLSLGTQDLFAGELKLPEREPPPPAPSRAAGSSQGLELDLVPEFEDFGEFGDLADELSDDELGLPPPPGKPGAAGSSGSDVQAKRRDDPNDDPEDLLSTLFGDDR